jgi:hypothetical protein
MKMYSLTLVLLIASSHLVQSQTATTWDGFITDTHCGTNCERTSKMNPDLACVRLCVKKGSKYGLWTGNRVYVLEPQLKASHFAAEEVRVTGQMKSDVIQITSITRIPQKAPPSSQ